MKFPLPFLRISFIIAVVSTAFAISGCQKDTDCIYLDKSLCDPNHVPDTSGTDTSGTDTTGIPFDVDLTGYQPKTLLEEFTGYRCINCPTASATAANLKSQYPDRLTVVAIHCTSVFAAPLTNDPNEPFHLDFRTPEGEEYVEYFGPDGLPSGVIDRLGTETSQTISYPDWANRLNTLMAETDPEVYLGIDEVAFSSDSTTMTVQVTVKPLILDPEENYIINLGLTESGIIEAQKFPDGSTDYNYEHNHVFRGNSDGTWGREAYEGTLDLMPDRALSMDFSMDISPEWNLDHAEIFVYVYRESNREVIQVEEQALGE